MKNKIVSSDLLAERHNCNFDKAEMKKIMFQDEETLQIFERTKNEMLEDPFLRV